MRTLAVKEPSHTQRRQAEVNHAVVKPSHRSLSSGVLQRKSSCACGGGCPRCQEQGLLQTKLKISEPGDRYEQEADRIADEVMQMPEPSIQRQIKSEEEEEMVQTKAIADRFGPLDPDRKFSEIPPIVHEVLNSPGQPLDPETRTFMESRFGHHFSQVRVHTDEKAVESAETVNAQAYTVKEDIVFDEGQYSPDTFNGKHLLAHELTHVVQQSEGRLSRQIQPSLQSQPLQLTSKTQTTRAEFHDPNFCYKINVPRDPTHPDLSKVVAVMQAQIVIPNACDGTVVLRTSVLQSDWGAAAAQFESLGGGGSQGLSEKVSRDDGAGQVDYEEHLRLDNCQAYFDRCHLITFYEGNTKYTFAEAGYQPRILAMSEPSGTVLNDATPAPRLNVSPCDHVTPTLCGDSSGMTGASKSGAKAPSSSTSTAKSKRPTPKSKR